MQETFVYGGFQNFTGFASRILITLPPLMESVAKLQSNCTKKRYR